VSREKELKSKRTPWSKYIEPHPVVHSSGKVVWPEAHQRRFNLNGNRDRLFAIHRVLDCHLQVESKCKYTP